MYDSKDPEKQQLLHQPAVRVRPAVPKDAAAIQTLYNYNVQHSPGATLDNLSDDAAKISRPIELARAPHLYYLVAEPAASPEPAAHSHAGTTVTTTAVDANASATGTGRTHVQTGLLGTVVVVPYKGILSGHRTCFDRTGSIHVTTYGEKALGAELDRAAKAALVDATVKALQTTGSHYKSLVTEMLFGEDVPTMKRVYDLYVEMGFRHVGTLKEVAEKNGRIFDQVIWQKSLGDEKTG